jgi:endonuclease YncB( thermonuclease family)
MVAIDIRLTRIDSTEVAMSGLLRIRGTLDTKQFWPKGTSDADTVNLVIDVDKDSFQFAPDGKKFKTTQVFFGAVSKGRGSKQVVSASNKITIRLQGIDAPELHYKAAPIAGRAKVSAPRREAFNAANKERRQHWGESGAAALGKKLGNLGDTIACEFVSQVDAPKEVTDAFGRFIGNIRVGKKFDFDVNTWLVEQGLAYPTFYTSMTNPEIEELLAAMGKGGKKAVFGDYSTNANLFSAKLLYRRPKKGVVIAIEDDHGELLMPKIYRRQVSYRTQKTAGIFSGSFIDFLASAPDECHTTRDFLKLGVHSAPTHKLQDFVKGVTVQVKPHELVFKELGSTLVDAKGRELDTF